MGDDFIGIGPHDSENVHSIYNLLSPYARFRPYPKTYSRSALLMPVW